MKIEHTQVFGFEAALRGMRNAKESWDRSDTRVLAVQGERRPDVGPNDLRLACQLIAAGGDHRKFLRQIMVWVDFTLPRNVWQELDTYKVATVRNSCSTMHKLGSRELTADDFEKGDVHPAVVAELNAMGVCYRTPSLYREDDGKLYSGVTLLEHMKHRLPEGFLQRATWSGSYETLLRMYYSRKDHRMPQWSGPEGICEWIKALPYMDDFLAAGAA